MGAGTKIEWTDYTLNPWWGCARVSPGCERCYAETFAKRVGHGKRLPAIWGAKAERKIASEAVWREPLRWNREAAQAGVRRRVFCASMADVFEDRPDLVAPRARLWRLIFETPSLDWLLLTKRPENAARLWANARAHWNGWDRFEYESAGPVWPVNVWLGTTCEDKRRADERLPHLLAVPAAVRFVSYEPALEAVDFARWLPKPCPRCGRATDENDCDQCAGMGLVDLGPSLSWIIVGGESGPGARPFDLAWARSTIAQCKAAGVPAFCKQLGAKPHVDGAGAKRVEGLSGLWLQDGDALWAMDDPKGGDWSRWPHDLRVREWPEPRP